MESDLKMQEQHEKRQADDHAMVVDEEDRMARNREIEAQAKEEEQKKMTSVMRKNLPRPTVISTEMFEETESTEDNTDPKRLIKEEMLILMVNDNKKYPQKGMKKDKLPKVTREKENFSLEVMEHARNLVEEQLKADLGD